MKYIYVLIVIGLIALGGAVLSNQKNIVSYTAGEAVTIEKEVVVDALASRIEEAQEAHKSEILDAAQKAYDSAYDQAMLEIELEVTSEFRGEIEEREKVLQASSTAY